MITRWDHIDFRDLPSFLLLVAVFELRLSVYQEFELTISRLSGPNRVLPVLELDLSFSIKIDWVSQIIVNECIHHV